MKRYFCLTINIVFYYILSYFCLIFIQVSKNFMFSYVTLRYVITPLVSDNSKQGPISICLFTVVRNLQLTFLSNNQEGLKFQRSSRPLTLTIAGSAGDIIYIYSVPNFSYSNLACFKYALWFLRYIQTLFLKYSTTIKQSIILQKILNGCYIMPENKWNLLEAEFYLIIIKNSVHITSSKLLDFFQCLLKIGQTRIQHCSWQ